MSGLIQVVIALFVAVPLLIWSYIRATRRRKMLQEWAISEDLSYQHYKDRRLDDSYPHFQCLRQGHSRYAYNHIRGSWQALDFYAFDYRYVTGYGKHQQTHRFSAVMIESPIPLKDLLIRTEHIGDRVAQFFGADDIDFESIEFSEKYFVKASEKRWAFDVLHQRTIEFMLKWPTFNLQFDHSHVIAWRNKLFEPRDFQDAADLINGVLERMPGYLTKTDPVLKKPTRGRLRL